MSHEEDTTEGIEAALPRLETVSPFSSPPHSVELDVESPGGLRHRVRVEGQTRAECLDGAIEVLEQCCSRNLVALLSQPGYHSPASARS